MLLCRSADNIDEPSNVLHSDPKGSLLERGKEGSFNESPDCDESAAEFVRYNGSPLSKLRRRRDPAFR
jgi:hypothetical protein